MSEEIIQKATSARLEGDNATAIEICRGLIAQDAGNMDAVSLLGLSLAEIGALDEAAPLIERALASAPNNWRYILNQSVFFECAGDLSAARDAAERAVAAGPGRFEAWGRLGDLAGRLGDFSRAADALAKAIELNPEMLVLALRLAGAAFEMNDFDRASAALDLFDKAFPDHPQSLQMRVHIARGKCDWRGLIEAAEKLCTAMPNESEPRMALAFGYAQLRFYHEAVRVYRPLADAAPPDALHLATLAKYLTGARALEEGAEYYRRALDADPDFAPAAAGYARYLNFLGDFENAADFARKAIALEPANAEAFAELALAVNSDLTDREIEQLEEIGGEESADLRQRSVAWFACGDAWHRRKNRPAAFEAWAQANNLRRGPGVDDESARYDPAAHEAFTNWVMASFPEDRAPAYRSPVKGPVPIFIVGMPRSGTTLLDSAISSHARAASGGELPYMSYALTQLRGWAEHSGWRGGELPGEIIDEFRRKYFDQYREYGVQAAEFVTDKLPSNFLAAGLIRQVFPEAKIVHIRRNPVETGFSIYRRNFTREWSFSTSQDEIAHYYAEYARLTRFWAATVKENFAFVQYEDLVRNFEPELRRLIGFCGLEWDQNCLEYYRQDRTVLTFSAAQVRKPPSPEHLNSTAPYMDFLEPLRNALRARGVNLETGALLDS